MMHMVPSASSSPHYSPSQEADGKLKFKTLQLILGGGCIGACGRNQQTWINIDNKPESTNLRPLDPLHVEEIYF